VAAGLPGKDRTQRFLLVGAGALVEVQRDSTPASLAWQPAPAVRKNQEK
jgi:hypothetical protein